jgi:hypothetical protein
MNPCKVYVGAEYSEQKHLDFTTWMKSTHNNDWFIVLTEDDEVFFEYKLKCTGKGKTMFICEKRTKRSNIHFFGKLMPPMQHTLSHLQTSLRNIVFKGQAVTRQDCYNFFETALIRMGYTNEEVRKIVLGHYDITPLVKSTIVVGVIFLFFCIIICVK